MQARTTAFILILTANGLYGQVDVLTAQYDVSRTSSNMQEEMLTTTNVNSAQFGKLFTRTLDAPFYASPLIATGVNIHGVGMRDVVYVGTLGNTLYAFDADDPTAPSAYWSVNLGTPIIRSGYFLGPTLGILSTPVIDRSTNTIYLTAIVQAADAGLFLYALDLSTGAFKFNSPRRITYAFPSGTTRSIASQPSNSSWIQRAGLLLLNGVLYVATSNVWEDGTNTSTQEGFIQTFEANDLSVQLASFETTPSGLGGGIWQAGRGLAADASGNVYVAMDSGAYSPLSSFGESVVKFGAGTLSPSGWFTPANWNFLWSNNLNVSANGVTLIPGTNLAFAGGKSAVVYLLDQTNLGSLEPGSGNAPLQEFSVGLGCTADCGNKLPTAYWPHATNPYMYAWATGDYLRAFPFDSASQRFLPNSAISGTVLPFEAGGMSISSNGSTAGTGLVWATTAVTDPLSAAVPGTLRAFNAVNVTQELYNSDQNSCRDALGLFVKMSTPMVANGKVYVNTQSNLLDVYGLLPSTMLNVTISTSPPGLVASVDGATCTGSSWVPGSQHTLSAPSPQAAGPGTQYIWSSWSDGGAISHPVAPVSNASYIANFTAQYLLSTAIAPLGAGSITTTQVSAAGYYNTGTQVQLTATAIAGCTFVNWSGELSGSMNTQRVMMSAPLAVTANFQCSAPPPSFLTGFALNGPPQRNDFSGWVGMEFTVGATPLTVSALGRIFLPGNVGTHTVKLVQASNGMDAPGGSAAVPMAGGVPGQFQYVSLASPIMLQANTAYYLVSQEVSAGDTWYNSGTVSSSALAAVNGSVWLNVTTWTLAGGANTSYVPPNFLMTTPPGLSVSPLNGTFSTTSGSSAIASQPIGISNSGTGTLSWTASASQPWMLLATTSTGAGQPSISGTGPQTIWIQTSASGLAPRFYSGMVTVSATGAVGSPQIVNVSLAVYAPPPSTLWPNGYSYAGTITVSHTQVPNTDQTNFPVLISGTYPDLAVGKVTNANGYDIIFTSDAAGMRPLPFERQSYSPATGNAAFWVQLPTLSHTSDTTFYIFYGNPSVTTDQSNKTAVWDGNYAGVWHLGDNAANTAVSDSTANGNNGTAAANTNQKAVTGILGTGLSFNGSTDQVTTSVVSGKAFTWEAWVNSPALTSAAYQSVLTIPGSSYMLMDVQGGADSLWSPDGLAGTGLGAGSLANSMWYHLALVRSGDSSANGYTAYVNGAQKGQAGSGVWSSAANLAFGARPGTVGQNFTGVLDEIRVSKTARSADWITAEYHNESSPSMFYSAVWGQTYSGGISPPPALSVSPGTLTFTMTAGGSNPAAQSVTISSGNGTTLGNWTASITSGSSFIEMSSSASGPFSTASINGSGNGTIYVLAAGSASNSGVVTITSSTATPTSAPLSVSLTVNPAASGSTWPNGYSYSGTITVSHLQVPNSDQTNFPVLVEGTYPDLAVGKVTNANGYDIIFTSDSAGMKPLPFERQSYSPSTGQVAFWVQVPTLSHTADTTFYIFYGKPSVTTDQSNKTAVWDANYAGVWHLGDNAANTAVSDSTANGNNGTAAANTNTKVVNGIVGTGLSFNGSTDQVTTSVVSGKTFTWEVWVNSPVTTSATYQSAMTIPGSSYMLMDVQGGADSLWSADGLTGASLGAGSLANNTWYHLVLVRSGDSSVSGYTAYVSGAQKGQAASGVWSSAANLAFGARPGTAGQNFTGILDEIRVSQTVRSADWIATEFHNQSSPSTFYSTVWGQTYSGGTSAPPALSVSPGTLTFTMTAGGSNPPAQSVTISSVNTTALGNWTASIVPGSSFIQMSTSVSGPFSSVSINGSGNGTIYVLASGSASNSGTVTITSSTATPTSAPVSVSLTVNPAASGSTWPNGYSYAGTITVSHLQVPNMDQTNFPVLVSGAYPALGTTANGGQVTNANGYDIIFTSDAAGMKPLNFERQNYSPMTGQVAFWVQLPALSHASDTTFYIFYGNPSVTTDQSSKTAVWDANYTGVWHMGDNAANTTVSDSSANGNNGIAAANTSTKAVAGILGTGLSFNGSTDLVTTSVANGKTFTWEAWVNSPAMTSGTYQSVLTIPGSSYMLMDVQLGADSLWSTDGLAGTTLGSAGLANNTWYHLAFVRSGDNSASGYTAYVNGVQKGQAGSGVWGSAANLTMGARIGIAGQNFSGSLDEVRVSKTVRSADWIVTEYHNQSNPATFYSIVLGLTE